MIAKSLERKIFFKHPLVWYEANIDVNVFNKECLQAFLVNCLDYLFEFI